MVVSEAKWYILQVYSGFENKVVEAIKDKLESVSLSDLVLEIIIPMYEVAQVRRGKKLTAKKNLFPGYILLKAILTDELLATIRSVAKVSSFLGGKLTPTPVSDQEVKDILQKIQENVENSSNSINQFDIGDMILISEGPFASFNGTVEEVDVAKSKLKILVSIFDRMVPVEVDFSQVEKVNE